MGNPRRIGKESLRRMAKLIFASLIFVLNQRWGFLLDEQNNYRLPFVWYYLDRAPEVLAYSISLMINISAGILVVRSLCCVAGRADNDGIQSLENDGKRNERL